MSLPRQIGAVTLMKLRSIPQRLGTSLVIVIGIAGVVAVLVGGLFPAIRAARQPIATALRAV